MSFKEIRFRSKWFGNVLINHIFDVVTYRPPKGYGVIRKVAWELRNDEKVLERFEGTFWDFTKWLITHKTFDDL